MKTNFFYTAQVVALCAGLVSACGPVGAGNQNLQQPEASQSNSNELFVDAQDDGLAAPMSDEDTSRSVLQRHVRVDLSRFKEAARAAIGQAGESSGKRLNLNLFNHAKFDLSIDGVEEVSPENAIVTGRIADEPDSSVTIVMKDDVLVGNVRRPQTGELFEIRYMKNGLHAVRSVKTDIAADCGATQAPDAIAASEAEVEPADEGQAFVLSHPVIDMLVAYTPKAKAQQGGDTAIRALIQMGIADTNKALADSGVSAQVRLVYTMAMSQNEGSSMSTDLSKLKGTSDGLWDAVHTRRNQYGADQVSMITAYYSGLTTAGIGYINSSSTSAFTITRAQYFGQFTFSHELGHNIGLQHSQGYQNSSGRFRTVMAYGSYPRVRRFSNPNLTYNGYRTGTSSQNSAATLNKNASRLASFRAVKVPVTTH